MGQALDWIPAHACPLCGTEDLCDGRRWELTRVADEHSGFDPDTVGRTGHQAKSCRDAHMATVMWWLAADIGQSAATGVVVRSQ